MGLLWQKTWAVAGGKAGVGKTFVSSGLACALAADGYRTVLIDADPAGSEIQSLFGLRRNESTLDDFIRVKTERFYDTVIRPAIPNLHVILKASAVLDITNPSFPQRQRLLDNLSSIDADFIVVDMGAGMNYGSLDFFDTADLGILVTGAAQQAIQSAYGFLRMAVYRKLMNFFADNETATKLVHSLIKGDGEVKSVPEFVSLIGKTDPDASDMLLIALGSDKYRLIVDRAAEAEEEKVSRAMSGAALEFLGVKLSSPGSIEHWADFGKKTFPAMFIDKDSISDRFRKVAGRLAAPSLAAPKAEEAEEAEEEKVKEERPKAPEPKATEIELPKKEQRKEHVKVRAADKTTAGATGGAGEAVKTHLGINNEIFYEGMTLHIQTEDLGRDKGKIRTLVFSGGQILFSKVSDYADYKDKPVPEMVRWQHKVIIAGIMAGKLKDKIMPPNQAGQPG